MMMKSIQNFLVKHRIKKLFNSYDLYFITLTFNDLYLSNSTYKDRLEMIKNYLNKNCKNYIAGQNFSNKEREYYACLCSSKVNYKEYPYNAYGSKVGRTSPEEYMKYFIDKDFIVWK